MQKYAKEEKTVQCTVCKSSEQIHSKTHPASWNTFGIFQQQWPLSQNVSWIFKMEDPVNQNTPSIVHMSNPDTDSWQRGTHTHISSFLPWAGPSIIICSCCSGRKQRDRRCTYKETAVIIWHQPKKYSIMGKSLKMTIGPYICIAWLHVDSPNIGTLMTPPTNELGSPWKRWTP